MGDLHASLSEFGGDPSSLFMLDEESPDLLPYASLLTARRTTHRSLGIVKAVYEWDGRPLMFLVESDSWRAVHQLNDIRRQLAMRGDAPYLGVLSPGNLYVYRIALDNKSLRRAKVNLAVGHDNANEMALVRLGNERPHGAITHRGWISNVVLRLFSNSMDRLIDLQISPENAISLVGRALFTRFLGDRSLLPEPMSGIENTAGLFDTWESAATTCSWLDNTFNGDLLPLSDGVFEILPKKGLDILGDVLRRAPEGQLFLGWQEKWANLDFAHIPVGVLSQAYELYLRKHAPNEQRTEGGYFTPKPIAELMTRASFRALQRTQVSKSARVLDPAVGAGIFLLTAFRELVAENWRNNGRRPDSDEIRRILNKQLVGFDVNESALRLTALGLYLLSIELDPEPRPVDKLRFDNLRGRVLHRVKGEHEKEGDSLGSLGPLVGEEHRMQYDLVIGNPPWVSSTKLKNWNKVRETVEDIAADRGSRIESPPLPNEVLDLPFLWRSMEWAKPNAQIAFALHGRLLFQQGDGMPAARQALFEALDVTSIINGGELRKTKVWPQVSAPFCILFATNRTPSVDSGFRLISPRIESPLNNAAVMRVDTINAEVVSARQLFDTPDVLKILFRGSNADLGILERIRTQGHPTLAEYWEKGVGVSKGGRMLGSGNGYQTLKTSSRTRKYGDQLPGANANYLHGLPEIKTTSFNDIIIDTSILSVFSHERIHDPRSRNLFIGPQVIVHKSPPSKTGRINVAISDKGVVFNQTFYGYSPKGHPEADTLVRYLALVLGSKLVIWLALITSGEFGVERESIEKATLDRIPLPDFDKLDNSKRHEIGMLIEGLHLGKMSWNDVDDWVRELYGLGERDWQVVLDTLEFNLPFPTNKKNAQIVPSFDEIETFCDVLREELNPWCERLESSLAIDPIDTPPMSPWRAIAIRRQNSEEIIQDNWEKFLRVADRAAVSEVMLDGMPDELIIWRLAQRRYWSKTQARLLSQRIVWSHIELLKRHDQ